MQGISLQLFPRLFARAFQTQNHTSDTQIHKEAFACLQALPFYHLQQKQKASSSQHWQLPKKGAPMIMLPAPHKFERPTADSFDNSLIDMCEP
jgi:hypothetical protein